MMMTMLLRLPFATRDASSSCSKESENALSKTRAGLDTQFLRPISEDVVRQATQAHSHSKARIA
jgi:hypothetical protein